MNGNSILGGYQSDFARNCTKEGRSIGDLIAEVIEGTLARSGIGPEAIETIHVANAFGQIYTGQGHLGAMPATVVPGLWGKPAMCHEGACASGSLATLAAMAELEAGRHDCALVLGAEIEKSLPGAEAAAVQAAAAHVGHETESPGLLWPSMFDRIAGAYDQRYGIDDQFLRAIGRLNLENARAMRRGRASPDGDTARSVSPSLRSSGALGPRPMSCRTCVTQSRARSGARESRA